MKIIFALLAVVFSLSAHAKLETETLNSYIKAQILLNRFGNKELQELRGKVLNLRAEAAKSVVGQNDLAAALQTRLLQYLNSLGSRTGEPVAMHMIGLTGIGKTSIIKVLEDLGFPIYKIVAEHYPGGDNSSGSEWRLMEALEKAASLQKDPRKPLILFIDEIDKTPEITATDEIPQPVISSLNEILSEGQLTQGRAGRVLKFSNIFVMTAMNFAPSQIESFASEIVKADKSYWQFNEDDMRKFDEWIRSGDQAESSVARLLEQLFRSNTVGRMTPDTVVAKALFSEDFDQIVDINIREVIRRLTSNKAAGLRVTTSPAYRAFLRKFTTFAPSGARMSVKRIDLLTEQLVSIASRADTGDDRTLMLPRDIHLDFDPTTNEAVVNIIALTKTGTETKIVGTKEFRSTYSRGAGSFVLPDNLIKNLPVQFTQQTEEFAEKEAEGKLSSSQIREHRMALRNDHALGKHLKTLIHDQDEIIDEVDRLLHLYMNSEEEGMRYLTIPGFPGVGKTRTITEAAEYLGIPVVKMNMQEYSGDSQESSDRFGEDLIHKIEKAVEESETGKYIVLFEEIDKTYEVNPMDGTIVNRPVMSYLKDLLSDGVRKVTIKSNYGGSEIKTIDIRDAFTFLTMNFAFDRFEVSADPRLTTIKDMEHIYEEIKSSPLALRNLLSNMFLPETVNRLITHLLVSRPLTQKGYEKILKGQISEALRLLSSSEDAIVNVGGFNIKPTRAYMRDYLFAESVIPSEGGRQAQEAAKKLLLTDVLEAIQNLPVKSPLIRRPVDIVLDFKPKNTRREPTVVAFAKLSDKDDIKKNKGDHKTELFTAERDLRFPPTIEFEELSPRRAHVSMHEFGHAMSRVINGARFETAIGQMPDGGGLVKHQHLHLETGRTMLADLLSTLGSRAMERIMMSENPLKPESVLNITNGPVIDIGQNTKRIWEILHQFGMDPGGGVVERSGLGGDHRDDYMKRPYHFEGLSDDKIEQLGLVLRDMEDFMVAQFLAVHSKDWYQKRIAHFAHVGQMREHEFYDLIGYSYPGDNNLFVGEELKLSRDLGFHMKDEPDSVIAARKFVMGNGMTAPQNLENAVKAFRISIANRLHDGEKPEVCEEMVTTGAKKKKAKKKSA